MFRIFNVVTTPEWLSTQIPEIRDFASVEESFWRAYTQADAAAFSETLVSEIEKKAKMVGVLSGTDNGALTEQFAGLCGTIFRMEIFGDRKWIADQVTKIMDQMVKGDQSCLLSVSSEIGNLRFALFNLCLNFVGKYAAEKPTLPKKTVNHGSVYFVPANE